MMKTIKIFGDKYKLRKTYNISEFGFGVYGYEVYNESENFLRYFEGVEDLGHLKDYIKAIFYKIYSKYSY